MCFTQICILQRFPQQQLGALLQLSLLLCLLGPPSRDPALWGPRCTRSQCERAAVTTSGPSMRAAFGAEEKLRAGREMKPIMGFLSICFILALNACPPLTLRMEFYCVQVRRHRRLFFKKPVSGSKMGLFRATLLQPAGLWGYSVAWRSTEEYF